MVLLLNFTIETLFLGIAFYLAHLSYLNWPVFFQAEFQFFSLYIIIFLIDWFFVSFFFYNRTSKKITPIIFTSFLMVLIFNFWATSFDVVLPFGLHVYLILFTFLSLVLAELFSLFVYSFSRFSERLLIIGGGHNAQFFIEESCKQIFKKTKIVGIIDNNISMDTKIKGIPVLGKIINLKEVIKEYNANGVVQAEYFEQAINIITFCRANKINYKMIPFIAGVYSRNISEERRGELILLNLQNTSLSGLSLVVKRVLDLLGSIVLMVVFLPIFVLVAVLLRLEDSKAPILITEDRYNGYRGKSFKMFRFRTLPKGERERVCKYKYDEVTEHLSEIREDERATKLGRFLRKTKISELPQLLDVILGQMSLIGPRPPYKQEVEQYEDVFKKRLLVTPGMTGLWQVTRKQDRDFKDMFELDSFYVENWSFRLDILILFKTVKKILRFRG